MPRPKLDLRRSETYGTVIGWRLVKDVRREREKARRLHDDKREGMFLSTWVWSLSWETEMSSALCTSIYYAAIGPMLRRLSGDPRPHNLRALLLRSQSLNSYPGFPQSENCLKDVRANCFCAFFVSANWKFIVKWIMIGQMAIAIALPGFDDLGRSVTPIFFWWNTLSTDFLRLAKKWRKSID